MLRPSYLVHMPGESGEYHPDFQLANLGRHHFEDVRRVVDIGCGSHGYLAEHLKNEGIWVRGVNETTVNDDLIRAFVEKPFDTGLPSNHYDLVVFHCNTVFFHCAHNEVRGKKTVQGENISRHAHGLFEEALRLTRAKIVMYPSAGSVEHLWKRDHPELDFKREAAPGFQVCEGYNPRNRIIKPYDACRTVIQKP